MFTLKRRAVCALAAAALSVSLIGGQAAAEELELVEPGVLTVAFNGDMPGTGWQDGKG